MRYVLYATFLLHTVFKIVLSGLSLFVVSDDRLVSQRSLSVSEQEGHHHLTMLERVLQVCAPYFILFLYLFVQTSSDTESVNIFPSFLGLHPGAGVRGGRAEPGLQVPVPVTQTQPIFAPWPPPSQPEQRTGPWAASKPLQLLP